MFMTIIILAAIAAAVFFAVRAIVRDRKSGTSCGGSSGGCSGNCASCAYRAMEPRDRADSFESEVSDRKNLKKR